MALSELLAFVTTTGLVTMLAFLGWQATQVAARPARIPARSRRRLPPRR